MVSETLKKHSIGWNVWEDFLDPNKVKVKFALVRILWDDRFEVNTAPRNVWLLYLKSSIDKSWWDCVIFHELDMKDAVKSLLDGKFDVIWFTIHVMNIEETLSVCRDLKKYAPNINIILWWHHASWSADSLLDLWFIDSVFIWDSEKTITDYMADLENWNTPKKKYIPATYDDLDKLSFPFRDDIHKIERIVTTRWCPFSCTFCTTPMLRTVAWEPTYRERSPNYVVDEIEYLVSNGAKRIIFNDDLFCLNSKKSHERIIAIADWIISRGIQVTYKVQLRVDSITDKDLHVLKKLKESGLREVFLWIESGSDTTLKSFWKKATREENMKAIKFYEENWIKVNAWNILATADSTIEDINESINAFREVWLWYLLFRRITTKAVVFPWTQLEKDLFEKWFIERKWHYQISSYQFFDDRVGRIVNLLETHLSYFLSEIWEMIFPLRNKALVVHNDNDKKTNIPWILREWSDLTCDFLLYWFNNAPDSFGDDEFFQNFNLYIESVKSIYDNLLKEVDIIPPYQEFYADTF